MPRPVDKSSGRARGALRTLAAVFAVGCCLAAAALAADRVLTGPDRATTAPALIRPKWTKRPPRETKSTNARFAFREGGRRHSRGARATFVGFRCRLDRRKWRRCKSPIRLRRLAVGPHRFRVRAMGAAGNRSKVAHYKWRVRPKSSGGPGETTTPPPSGGGTTLTPPGGPPKPTPEPGPGPTPEPGPKFSIELTGELDLLYPGAPAQPLTVTLTNPNRVAIQVTSLSASTEGAPPACTAENFVLAPSNASASNPIPIAAESSVTLPVAGVLPPTIEMVELPRSQDGCQGVSFPIHLSGEATE